MAIRLEIRLAVDERPDPWDGLSEAQINFAELMSATPGLHSIDDDRAVYMYRKDQFATNRWLVDEVGRVLDSATIH